MTILLIRIYKIIYSLFFSPSISYLLRFVLIYIYHLYSATALVCMHMPNVC
jgi:hypothetical protein